MIYVIRQSASLVFNPIMVDNYDFKLFTLVGWGWSFLSVAWPCGVQLVFFFSPGFCLAPKDLQHQAAHCDCRTTAETEGEFRLMYN